jgi:hypothetical protein
VNPADLDRNSSPARAARTVGRIGLSSVALRATMMENKQL